MSKTHLLESDSPYGLTTEQLAELFTQSNREDPSKEDVKMTKSLHNMFVKYGGVHGVAKSLKTNIHVTYFSF